MPPIRLEFTTSSDSDRSILHRKDHIIVRFGQAAFGTNRAENILNSIIGRGNYRPVGRALGAWTYLHVRVDPGKMLSILDDLNAEGDVEFAELDLPLVPCITPNDPMLKVGDAKEQWGLGKMNMFKAWDIQTGTDDVVIALMDSGVPLPETPPAPDLGPHQNLKDHLDHIDLDGKRFIAGWDYVNKAHWPRDDPGLSHGTEMAGIMAAMQDNTEPPEPGTEPTEDPPYIGTAGVNWASPIFAHKVMHWSIPTEIPEDSELRSTGALVAFGIADAIDYAKSFSPSKKLVINLSLMFENQDDFPEFFPEGTLKEIFKMVEDYDAIACIAASGIHGTVAEPGKFGATTAPYSDNVIVVGEIDKTDKTLWRHQFVDMVYAPGDNVGTTNVSEEGFTLARGTSPATAHVSGLAAVMWSEAPDLTAKRIVTVLKDTCRDPGVWEEDNDLRNEIVDTYAGETGHGIVDAYAGLQRLKPRLCLVLDRSGSMGGSSGISGLTRMQILKTAVGDLIDLVDIECSVALTRFNGAGQELEPLTVIEDIDPAAAAEGTIDPRVFLKDRVSGLEPEGSTSIAAGIEAARKILDLADAEDIASGFITHPPKAIIVLTDGRENQSPFLEELMTGWPQDIPVYAIGMGAPEVLQPEPLENFLEPTGGYMVTAEELEFGGNNLISEFLGQILTEIADYEPVEDPAMVIKPGPKQEFHVNLGPWDRCADIQLIADPDAPLEVSVFAPGERTEPYSRTPTTRNGRVSRYQVSLPPFYSGSAREMRGQWRVEVSLSEDQSPKGEEHTKHEGESEALQEGVPYILMINTRSSLKMHCRIQQSGFTPGSEMKLVTTLTNGGVPFTSPIDLKVNVTGPGGGEPDLTFGKEKDGSLTCWLTAHDPGIYHWHVRAKNTSCTEECFQRERRMTGAVWHPTPILGLWNRPLPYPGPSTQGPGGPGSPGRPVQS